MTNGKRPRLTLPLISPRLAASSAVPTPEAKSLHRHPGPAIGPAPASPLSRLAVQATDWDGWMLRLACELRRLRRSVGLSQRHLARRAGVSQGAVSRFETGRARMTPLLDVVKICLGLWQSIATSDRDLPSDALRALVDGIDRLVPFTRQGDVYLGPITTDANLGDLVRLYRAAPDTERRIALAILRTAR